jgi:hypothetical protein
MTKADIGIAAAQRSFYLFRLKRLLLHRVTLTQNQEHLIQQKHQEL